MKYGIAIFPSKQLQDIANSYRKRYDKQYAFISPHITLKYPFEANENEISTIADQVKQITRQVEPFTIHVTRAKTFHPVNKTVYLKVETTPELEKLFDAFNSEDFFGNNAKHIFVPHITIAEDIPNGEHLDLLGQLTNLNLSQKETIDQIHLLFQLEDGVWTVHETFHLGAE